jgi:hypothetical protein
MRSLGGRVKYSWGLLGLSELWSNLTVRHTTRLTGEYAHKKML